MRVSAKADYAIRAVVELAAAEGTGRMYRSKRIVWDANAQLAAPPRRGRAQ